MFPQSAGIVLFQGDVFSAQRSIRIIFAPVHFFMVCIAETNYGKGGGRERHSKACKYFSQ